MVRNLAFCTEVQSYGCVKPFKAYEFAPGQEVLLYAEVENFTSEATPKGYHTALRSSYQVLDGRGQRVADARVDVYGLGALLYHCLTGRPPFTSGSLLKLLAEVMSDPPTPPSKLRPEIPAGLEAGGNGMAHVAAAGDQCSHRRSGSSSVRIRSSSTRPWRWLRAKQKDRSHRDRCLRPSEPAQRPRVGFPSEAV